MSTAMAQNEQGIISYSDLYQVVQQIVQQQFEQRNKERELDLIERIVRLEEGQKDLKVQMDLRFQQVDKRFEDLLHSQDKRFEQVDKRFEQVDKRFDQIDKRFEQADKRIEDLIHSMNRRFQTHEWIMGFGFLLISSLVTIYQFLG